MWWCSLVNNVFLGIVLLLLLLLQAGPTDASVGSCVATNDARIVAALQRFPECSIYLNESASSFSSPQQIYVPEIGFPQAVLDAMRGVFRALGSKTDFKKYLPRSCADQSLRYFCSFVFRPCSAQGFARPPCNEICTSLATNCRIGVAVILATANASSYANLLTPPCESVESGNVFVGSSPEIAGQPMFPLEYQTWNVSGILTNVTCNNAALISPIPFPCYAPSWQSSNDSNQPYCVLNCPLPIHTSPTLKINAVTLFIVSLLGIVIGFAAIVVRAAIPQFREYPSNLVLFSLAAMWLSSCGFFFPFLSYGGSLLHRVSSFICDGDDVSRGFRTRAQGAFIYWMELTGLAYWGAIAIHTLIAVRWGPEILNRKTKIITHIICVVPASILAIVVFGAHLFRGNPVVPFAFFKAPNQERPYPYIEYLMYWAITGIVCIGVIVCVVLVLVGSVQRQMRANQFHWIRNVRIMLYLGVILFVEVWKWSYRMHLLRNQRKMVTSTYHYVQCQITRPDCKYEYLISQGMVRFFFLFFSCRCILASLVFGVNTYIWRHWTTALLTRVNPFSSDATVTEKSQQETLKATMSITDA